MRLILIAFVVFLSSCSILQNKSNQNKGNYSEKAKNDYTKEFYTWLDKKYDEAVDRYPQWQTYLGIKKDYDKLNDLSDERNKLDLELAKVNYEQLKQFDFDRLTEQGKISYELKKQGFENKISDFKYRFHNYPFNQMFGEQSSVAAFMINMHQIVDEKDARAYISRVTAAKHYYFQVIEGMRIREKKGIIPPTFVFAHVYGDIDNLLHGKPFDDSKKDSSLLEDFKSKVGKLKISKDTKELLIADLNKALLESFKPALQETLSYLKALEPKSDTRAGIWKFPNGEEYYRLRLKRMTTTDYDPQYIHDLGLREVARIRGEMEIIKKRVGFEGDLKSFFAAVKKNKNLYYPNSKQGRESYLSETHKVADAMNKKLVHLFSIPPRAKLKIKAVEPFREKSAGIAFYQRAAPDGSRPGIYYVNLYDMSRVPKYELEALYYHEAIPGHHMQLSIALEMEQLPKFRRFGGYTAFTEGWGLYAEFLPKEVGLYQDPYSDFGRLSMELWRAARLVVDTGLHYKKWTREQTIEYMENNTPNGGLKNVKDIERYIVMPAQATAYKVGMLKILELRKFAEDKLGDKFDLRKFHDSILQNGSVPLDVLEDFVKARVKDGSLEL